MHALIINNHQIPVVQLKEWIQMQYPNTRIINIVEAIREAIVYLNSYKVDILLMDVSRMEKESMGLLGTVDHEKIPPCIITDYKKCIGSVDDERSIAHHNEPIKTSVLPLMDMTLVKKKRWIRQFFSLLQSHAVNTNKWRKKLHLAVGNSYHLVDPKDVVRIEGSGSYSTFYLIDNRKIMVSKRIKYFENQLGEDLFLRTHQSHMVNVQFIQAYHKADGGFIEVTQGEMIPIGMRYKEQIKLVLGKL